MVALSFIGGFRTVAGVATAAAALFGSQAAHANSSNAADIAAPLRAAQEARQNALKTGDQEFRQHFASWRSWEKGTGLSAATVTPLRRATTVSIPSRMPVEGVRLSSDYGMRTHPVLGGRRGHKGVDLAGPVGTPILATADGMISKAEWFSSYGLYVSIEHGGDLQTRYGHMSRLNVAAGQAVRKGDVIGFIGSTGRSTGPHLHYEVRVAGQAVNPIPYMQADQYRAGPAASTALAAVTNGPAR